MRLVGAIAVLLGVLVATAAAQSSCTCYGSLPDCVNGDNGTPQASPDDCADGQGFFKYDNQANCRDTSSREVVSIRDNDCFQGIRCFRNLYECQSASQTTPWTNGFAPRSSCLPHNVYQCREEKKCRDVKTGYQIRQGAGVQDPHFRGFDGSTFYFNGEAGSVYNILSDTDLQVNSMFVRLSELKGTYMGSIGILFGDESLLFDPNFGVIMNGTLLDEIDRELAHGGALQVIRTANGRLRLTLEYGAYSIVARVSEESGRRAVAYTNLEVSLLTEPRTAPHGILGQTVAPLADSRIQGEESDYHVKDGLFGTTFTFNRFERMHID